MWRHLTERLDQVTGTYSLCVWNANGDQIYGYDEHAVRSAASLIKLPLAMAILDAVADGATSFDLTTTVTLQEADRVDGTGAFDIAPAGTIATVRDLIGYALRESDNTAANLLIDLAGFDLANRWLHLRGLQTRLRRKFMDFDALAAGRDNITTASDMCMIICRLQQPRYAPLLEDLQRSVNDGKLEAGLPPDVRLAHKVGDLPGVEHDAGIVFAPHGPYIMAALGVDLPDIQTGRRTIAVASHMVWNIMTNSE